MRPRERLRRRLARSRPQLGRDETYLETLERKPPSAKPRAPVPGHCPRTGVTITSTTNQRHGFRSRQLAGHAKVYRLVRR